MVLLCVSCLGKKPNESEDLTMKLRIDTVSCWKDQVAYEDQIYLSKVITESCWNDLAYAIQEPHLSNGSWVILA